MMADPPLAGCTVLDLSQFLAGPYCTQILADLGARVIKVEPAAGDPTRRLGPPVASGARAYYLSVNRNKESIVIDLKRERGREVLLGLAARCEVVVENFRTGVMERLGLDYERLAAVNSAVILCSISGFGQTGPYAGYPAYDVVAQAMAGVMSITGECEGLPVRTGVPIGDLAAGMFGAIGTLAALANARLTGVGSHVDIAMLDGQVSLLSYLAGYYLVSGTVPGPQGRDHLSIPTYRAFRGQDGIEFVVAANTERMWQRVCSVVGRPELVDDPRFSLNADRNAHRDVLSPILEAAFATRPSAVWIARLREEGVPVGAINGVDTALGDPQVRHRNMIVSTPDIDGSRLEFVGNPIKFTDRLEREPARPPQLGENTAGVLVEFLGMAEDEADELAATGVVGTSCG
jgi:CoA:oxalate CoA-transferase